MGLGAYYELMVVLERFANIFNTKNTSMIQIDPITKETLHQNKATKTQGR